MFNVCGTLLVDLNRDRPSTVSAGSNLIRCVLSASGLAVLQEIINGVGLGWCFTIFAVIATIPIPLLVMERHWGPAWRKQRTEKLGNKEEGDGGNRGFNETLTDSTTSTTSATDTKQGREVEKSVVANEVIEGVTSNRLDNTESRENDIK